MNKTDLAALITRHAELEADAIKLMSKFKGVKIKDIIKQSAKLAATGNLTPAGFGLPADVFERVQEYQNIGEKLRVVSAQLGGVNHESK